MGYFSCDDGNLLNGDGCSSICIIENGWQCSHTGPTRDICSEVCGVGINLGSKACDDGNLLSGDGCSSSCTIEKCWLCNMTSTCWINPHYMISLMNTSLSLD